MLTSLPPFLSFTCRWAVVLLANLVLAGSSLAWVRDEAPLWPDGSVRLEINLDGPRSRLSDGRTYDEVVRDAALTWNSIIARVQFTTTLNSSAPVDYENENGRNNLTFATRVLGEDFGAGVLAVTLIDYNDARRLEADVIFNRNETWDSFRGPLGTGPTAPVDLQRVALHELGHVLGLDHPDERGQWQPAIMRSIVDDLDALAEDDKEGAAELYGPGPGYVPPLPEIITGPFPADVDELSAVRFSVEARRAQTYQWKKNGVAVPGATESTFWIHSVLRTDAGDYTVAVSNLGGTVTSNAARLTVRPIPPPSFSSSPAPASVLEGQRTQLWVQAYHAMTYQWRRDGVLLPGATSATYSIEITRLTDAGDYTVEVGNLSGVITSAPARLTVVPADPPSHVVVPAGEQRVALGRGLYFRASASGSLPMTFEWYRDGVVLPGYSSSALEFTAGRDSGGTYHVVARNIAGSATSSPFVVVVDPVPRAAAGIVNVSVVGSWLSLVLASPTGGDTYQWYHDGVAIPGATSHAYYHGPLTAADGGAYILVVTTGSGSTIQRAVDVELPPANAAAATWQEYLRAGDVAYFLFASPARVERYDLAARSWLPALTLDFSPHTFAVGDDGIYGATAAEVRRVAFSGGASVPVCALPARPRHLFIWREFLVAARMLPDPAGVWRVNSYRRDTGALVDSNTSAAPYLYAITFSSESGRLFSRGPGSAQGFHALPIGPDGQFGAMISGSNLSAAEPTRVWLSPDGALLVDDEGGLVDGTSLATRATVPKFAEVDFAADGNPVVLRGARLIWLDGFGREERVLRYSGAMPTRFAVRGSSAAFFTPGGGSRAVEARWAEEAAPDPTGVAPADPRGPGIIPRRIELDRDGVVLVLSPLTRQLVRWSSVEQRFLPSLPLRGMAANFTYVAEQHRAYVGYPDGAITKLDLATGAETILGHADGFSGALVATAEWVIAGSTDSLRRPVQVWDAAGVKREDGIGFFAPYVPAGEFIWHAASRSVLAPPQQARAVFRHTITPQGTFAASLKSADEPGPLADPLLSFSPDGGTFLLADGRFYFADSLAPTGVRLAWPARDAAWRQGQLFTARDVIDGVELSRWARADYSAERVAVAAAGSLLRLLPLTDGRLLVVSSEADRLIFTFVDEALTRLKERRALLPSRLINLSARAWVGTDDQQVIPGFVVAGTGPKEVIVRANGPSLQAAGVQGFLANPNLVLYSGAGAQLDRNDDWPALPNLATFLARGAAVGANPFPPGSRDSGLLSNIAPGVYSAHTSGVERTTGISVIEVFDAEPADDSSRLVNISARARVGSGEDVLIVGFVIVGEARLPLLIHGLGPKLASVLPNTLVNPRLTLYDRHGQVLQTNDDWIESSDLRAAWTTIGAGALTPGSRDAALLLDLPPGLYSAILRGAGAGAGAQTGIGMIELYEVPTP